MPGAVARAGQRVLLVSLDPAHSLGDCLDVRLGPEDRAVPGSRGRLRAAEVDAPRAFGAWLRRHRALLRELGERGTYLRADEVDSFLDLTLPGVDELMGLRELLRLSRARPDHELVVDSAPTGHALRLLDAPAQLRQLARVLDDLQAKHRSLSDRARRRMDAGRRRSRSSPSWKRRRTRSGACSRRSVFTWVTHPEALAWEETQDGLAALRERGLTRQDLLVNRVTPRPPRRARSAMRVCARSSGVLRRHPAAGAAGRLAARSSRPEPRGAARCSRLRPRPGLPSRRRVRATPVARAACRRRPGPRVAARCPRRRRLVVFAGKGGVGKTSAAAATALEAAARWSQRVLLLSADPAHSLADVLDRPLAEGSVGSRDRARAGRGRARSPSAALGYRRRIEALLGADDGRSGVAATLDRALARDLLDEAPPGLDELFALHGGRDGLGACPEGL